MKGIFISIEGMDGSGKTTMTNKIVEYLESKGYEVLRTREPGGTVVSEKIRSIIIKNEMLPMTEFLLFAASRYEHTETVIKPALEAGKIVVCERYTDSSIAYQGYGRNLTEGPIREISKIFLNGFKPDHTFFFNVPYEMSRQRTGSRGEARDRFENEHKEFFCAAQRGFMSCLMEDRDRFIYISGNKPLDVVWKSVRSNLDTRVLARPAGIPTE